MKILVTGSDGQLGYEIKEISKEFDSHIWKFSKSSSFDLSKYNQIKYFLNKINPSHIINCAAYTDVDKAEIESDLADLINHKAIDEISKWTSKNDRKLIHISTDYVFDGFSETPLLEDSIPKPINEYGLSKFNGEKVCIKNDNKSIIIRTSWLYSSYGNNFVKTIINLMKTKNKIEVVNDQIGSPTYARDLALVIMKIINFKKWIPGIYNYSNEGKISWFDFANEIKKICNYDVKIQQIQSNKYKTKAKRPKYSILDKSKIKKTFGLEIFNYKKSLKKCLSILINEK